MLTDITLGQYYPGNSPIHKLDPSTKILLTDKHLYKLFAQVDLVSANLVADENGEEFKLVETEYKLHHNTMTPKEYKNWKFIQEDWLYLKKRPKN